MEYSRKENLDLYKRLKRLPIFWGIDEGGICELINLMQLCLYKEEEIVFNEDEEGDSLYIILSGKVEIFKTLEQNEQKNSITLATLSEKMIFGEMTLLAPATRTASARTHINTTLLRFDKKDFKELLDQGGITAYKLSYNIACIVCERLRFMDNRIIRLMQENEDLKKNELIQSMA
ncbi:cyclic nucleotide-binding domain-containing protein [Candidatus Riflebacteria bacterium]